MATHCRRVWSVSLAILRSSRGHRSPERWPFYLTPPRERYNLTPMDRQDETTNLDDGWQLQPPETAETPLTDLRKQMGLPAYDIAFREGRSNILSSLETAFTDREILRLLEQAEKRIAAAALLTDGSIPATASPVISIWTQRLSGVIPELLRAEWEDLLLQVAESGRAKENERMAVLSYWTWTGAVEGLRSIANAGHYGALWARMISHRNPESALQAAMAANEAELDTPIGDPPPGDEGWGWKAPVPQGTHQHMAAVANTLHHALAEQAVGLLPADRMAATAINSALAKACGQNVIPGNLERETAFWLADPPTEILKKLLKL